MPCRGGADELLEANRRILQQLWPDCRGERVFESEIRDPWPCTPPLRSGPASFAVRWRSGPGADLQRLHRSLHVDRGWRRTRLRRGRALDRPRRRADPLSGDPRRRQRDWTGGAGVARFPRAASPTPVGRRGLARLVQLSRAPPRNRRRAFELAQMRLKRASPPMVQPVDRVLGLAEPLGDLARCEPYDVSKHDDGALVLGQRGERLADDVHVVGPRPVDTVVRAAGFHRRRRQPTPEMVERRVVGEARRPGSERHPTLLVLRQGLVMSFANTSWVMSSASCSSLTMLAT